MLMAKPALKWSLSPGSRQLAPDLASGRFNWEQLANDARWSAGSRSGARWRGEMSGGTWPGGSFTA